MRILDIHVNAPPPFTYRVEQVRDKLMFRECRVLDLVCVDVPGFFDVLPHVDTIRVNCKFKNFWHWEDHDLPNSTRLIFGYEFYDLRFKDM